MTEDQIELLAIDLLKGQGWDYVHGSDIAPEDDCVGAIHELPLHNQQRRKSYSDINV